MTAAKHRPAARHLLLIAAMLLPVACASDPAVGTAVQRNVAFQAVDLDPHYAGVPVEGGNGTRAVDAVRRYNTNTVKQPSETSTGSPKN